MYRSMNEQLSLNILIFYKHLYENINILYYSIVK